MPPTRRFYFIRHGQSHANAGNYPAGRLDSPLTETGMREAQTAAAVIAALSPPPLRIFTSTLSRTRDTAAIINRTLGLPVTEEAGLCEQDYGDFQGVSKDDIHVVHGPHWHKSPPRGESFTDFRARIIRAMDRILMQEGGPPLVVGHGGMIMALSVPDHAGPEDAFRVANAAILRAEEDYQNRRWIFTPVSRPS